MNASQELRTLSSENFQGVNHQMDFFFQDFMDRSFKVSAFLKNFRRLARNQQTPFSPKSTTDPNCHIRQSECSQSTRSPEEKQHANTVNTTWDFHDDHRSDSTMLFLNSEIHEQQRRHNLWKQKFECNWNQKFRLK